MLDKLLSHVWMFENILWKFTNLVLYNSRKERLKRILYEIYWKKDVNDIFPPELDEFQYIKTLNALTTYYEPTDEDLKK